ncbi:UbiA prenyltransferase [Laetiporus sulphureus 93-53]|uniref:4-hydroxybenzoate polyprenyltransferase, mitochondrial n=1 Tax=Laetiporus sulphureus 93-53 TaxID=1314785 RepID=A0A165EBE9_9APHY|nr:UbiA prenyltransferase [Laetiporus sulphureus 93-53]KZT06656.1 UbiA prenyltransferase [Laetiporus sulphureus 93-53]
MGAAVDNVHPPVWRSLLRLTRLHLFPLGSDLAFWPSAWGLTLSACATGLPPKQLANVSFWFFVGGTLRHSAGCIWNDICDREYDRQVERTKSRPIASGAISVPSALMLYLAHVLACISLLMQAGPDATRIGLVSLVLLDVLYPFMKRWTSWPQVILGITSAIGVPVGWVTVAGKSTGEQVVAALFVGCICWTIYCDTIYACQDRHDDLKAGVHSTALLFGNYVRPVCAIFAAIFVACMATAGALNGQGPLFFIITVLGTAVTLAWQVATVDLDNGADCMKAFMVDAYLSYGMWAGMLLDYAYRMIV